MKISKKEDYDVKVWLKCKIAGYDDLGSPDEAFEIKVNNPVFHLGDSDGASTLGFKLLANNSNNDFQIATESPTDSFPVRMTIQRDTGNVGIGTMSPGASLDVRGQIIGGFGAQTTGGTKDWNDTSNTRSGNGYTLLEGNASNGPGPSTYFHAFNFEYSSKDGSGNITQFAIPYGAASNVSQGVYMRGRYSGSWSSWKRIDIPSGVIVMWSGSIGSIPSGWALCNGSNGTPDLRNRFIIAAGGSYGVGSTGGSTQHNHGGNTAGHTLTIAEMPSHSHNSRYNAWGSGERGDSEDTAYWKVTYVPTSSTGGDQPHSHGISNSNHLPPYYALAFIMKL